MAFLLVLVLAAAFHTEKIIDMKITQAILDELTRQAKESPRLRMNYDLRNSDKDQSQRMLNAIEPESVVPIHRHQDSSETVVCLRGRLVEEFYQEVQGSGFKVQDVQEPKAELVETIELSPNGDVVALNVPVGQWHTVKALESGSVILEMKDGTYEPISDADILQM